MGGSSSPGVGQLWVGAVVRGRAAMGGSSSPGVGQLWVGAVVRG